MSETKSKGGGRTVKHDPQFVRQVSYQILVAYYIRNGDEYARRVADDPTFPARLHDVSVRHDKFVRHVLDAASVFPTPEQLPREEIAYRVYRAKLLLETSQELLDKNMPEQKMRYYSRIYLDLVDQALAAIERVATNRPLSVFNIPPPSEAFLAEQTEADAGDDEYGL